MSKIDLDKINCDENSKINLIKDLLNNEDVEIKKIIITPKEKMKDEDIDKILNIICAELDEQEDEQENKQEDDDDLNISNIEYSDVSATLIYLLRIINAKFNTNENGIPKDLKHSVYNTILNNNLTEAINIISALDNKMI